ncbi:hypothetical protein CXG81DRAFT_16477 [Caulochytrium protostelioides]|uniref:FAS1 domain-containing protein n=1 Tax=Caulochytrium protostelioides TaxID=1555241 RepID=A0A4P9XFN8_9FUNG|nr:hypothetical protein CXG81DRAFT_16477 [Caulochytrium protostelioides]|eukprot:RKP04051.1 hypothetical protein CXG81DRAFT_16477 [Caulochytrium protostelioides]
MKFAASVLALAAASAALVAADPAPAPQFTLSPELLVQITDAARNNPAFSSSLASLVNSAGGTASLLSQVQTDTSLQNVLTSALSSLSATSASATSTDSNNNSDSMTNTNSDTQSTTTINQNTGSGGGNNNQNNQNSAGMPGVSTPNLVALAAGPALLALSLGSALLTFF